MQVGRFVIDHRIVECQFYRVQGNRILLKLVKDAGANLQPYNTMLAGQIRRNFNRKGWTYVSPEVLSTILLEETPMERALAMMPKKLNVKPEPTYKFNPHLPGTKL
jgi:hypothetical protein